MTEQQEVEEKQVEEEIAGTPVNVPSTMRRIELPQDKIFRISSSGNVNDVAWSIVKALEEGYRPILVGIGVQAVSQAIKSVCVANSRVASQGKIFTVLPAFENAQISDVKSGEMVERTLLKLILIAYKF